MHSLFVFRILIATGMIMGTAVLAGGDPVELVDLQGRSLKARLVSSDGVTVEVLRDGAAAPVSLPLKQLNDATRQLVSGWVEQGGNLQEKYDLIVETGKTRKKDGTEDFDDKRVNLSPVIMVKNPDTKFETRDGSVTVLFFGRPVDSATDIFVFKKQEFDLPKLKPLETATFKMEQISQAYDSRGLAKFGSRYLGYAVLIHDAAGKKMIFSKSVPSPLATDYGLKLLALKNDTAYDRDLESKPSRR